jgi:hypothetical protein
VLHEVAEADSLHAPVDVRNKALAFRRRTCRATS